ncbi:plastocyanin/azurin family copper-binding protein [Paenibacillus sp. NEAU-GSW1]|uniref:plastocyanin/azurin family copper-binding protein n=1 Tax=Paenibacillus sp. NEAU-GSW1 TaxID=2682486 RepID=UPI001566EF57|nr:plastocyanin/azurin family copper-binding protein [Paenibacillus sp. NEAU-GSW1]
MHEDAHAAGSSAPSGKSGGKNTESTPTAKETTKPAVQATSTPKATPTNTPVAESVGKVHVVEIKNFAFSPSKLEIKAGDSVKFINKDEVRHTATADDDSFDTGLFGQDEEKVVVFSEEGEFAYYCAPHPAMLGTITVSAK